MDRNAAKTWFIDKFRTVPGQDKPEPYVTLSDDAPAFLQTAVRVAHSNGFDLPNDWIYEACSKAWSVLLENPEVDEYFSHVFAENECDIYDSDIWNWGNEMHRTRVFQNAESNAQELFGGSEDIGTRISRAQYCCLCQIADIMKEAFVNNIENVLEKDED